MTLAGLRWAVVAVVVVALVYDLSVVECLATYEELVVLVVGFKLRSDLVHLGNKSGIEVAIAVVGVDVVVAFVTPLAPPHAPIRQGCRTNQ